MIVLQTAQVFNCLFVHIDRLWSHRKAVRTDFAAMIGAHVCMYVCVNKT